MQATVFFSTTLAVANKLENNPPDGIMVSRLDLSGSQSSAFDLSCINLVANINLNKISTRTAVDYLLKKCDGFAGKHYIDLSGQRLSIKFTDIIYAEADRIDRNCHNRAVNLSL